MRVKNGSITLNKATDKISKDKKKAGTAVVTKGSKVTKSPFSSKQKTASLLSANLRNRNPQEPGPTKGLRSKMPKSQQTIHNRLKTKSPWYQSIIDPIRGADAKIPDETGVETGTLQLIQKFAVTTNLEGITGFRILSPYINNVPTGLTDPEVGSNYQVINPTSANGSSMQWGAANVSTGVFTNGSSLPFDGVDEMQSVSGGHRIVSAGLYVQPECSTLDDKGEYSMFVIPMDSTATPLYSDYMNFYKSNTIPLNSGKAGNALWYPIDRTMCSFHDFVSPNATAFAQTTDGPSDNASYLWNIGFVTSGCEEGVTFRVTVCINYEFIPLYNVLNILDSSPSPCDAVEVDLVENWVQEMPVTKIVPQSVVSRAPQTVEPQHGETDEGTGFGMFFNVVKEILPFAALLL